MAVMKLVEESPSVLSEGAYVEKEKFVVILSKHISSRNYKEDVLHRRNAEASVIKVRDFKVHCR